MTTIRVLHCNTHGDGWTAYSPDLEGWSVAGASYRESRTAADDAVRARLSEDGTAEGTDVQIKHHIACSR